MPHFPDFDRFTQAARGVNLVPVYRRLLADGLTPVSAFHKIDAGQCACLFESVVGGEKIGRYSFLAADPYLRLDAWRDRLRVTTTSRPVGNGLSAVPSVGNGLSAVPPQELTCPDPLDELRRRVRAVRAAHLPELPRFTSGAVGYAGYDVVRYTERLPNAPDDDRGLPDLSFAFYDRMVVFDHVTKTLTAIAMADVGTAGDTQDIGRLRSAYNAAAARVDQLVGQLSSPAGDLPPVDIDASGPPRIAYTSNRTQADFEDAVRKCVEYIRAGDIFQVVISQRLEVPLRSEPFEVYRTLRVVNPSPFMFYLRAPEVTLVGSSPEIMVRVVDGDVTVRPLAGTRRRGADDEEDRRLAEELLADPKERAEHVMLVDLGRNDVGRVARYGSVKLSDVMSIERYSHVMHITSNVTARLADGRDAFDALRACLPAGTVSGAPKVRAMEIIDQFEPHRRGPYAGAVGYIDFCGNMDTCIALRTMVIMDKRCYIQVGAGIVADSNPASEYQETLNKARGLLKAVEITEQNAQQSRARYACLNRYEVALETARIACPTN
jgi:anthranilate synthase component 1